MRTFATVQEAYDFAIRHGVSGTIHVDGNGPIAVPDLPPPDVRVTTDGDASGASIDVMISRSQRGKTYKGTGPTIGEAAKEVIGKILADPYSAEWIPRKSP